MGKKLHIISSRKEADEIQEKYYAEHPKFYLSGHFCPRHDWKACQKKHSEEVIVRAKLANKRARQIELIEVEESAPDLDEDFEAHMAAIEAEEVQVAKDWNDWNEGLLPTVRQCSHHLQPFTFTVNEMEYTLYGSAFSDRKSEPQADRAGVCVFL